MKTFWNGILNESKFDTQKASFFLKHFQINLKRFLESKMICKESKMFKFYEVSIDIKDNEIFNHQIVVYLIFKMKYTECGANK